jgi:DNA primase small subunit
MRRHEGFKSVGELRSKLREIVPSHVYYSTAIYEKPEEEMDAKEWLGADLFFDIDADHIPTPCNKEHDTWSCSCGETGKGIPPETCPKCGGSKLDDKSWVCEVCLESAKRETTKLIDMLFRDFGFSPGEIEVAFSGHRGYHITLEASGVRELDQIARREIVDYVTGIGFEPKFHGLGDASVPSLEEGGWRGRIARGTYEFLLNTNAERLTEIGFRKSDGVWKIKGVGLKNWNKIMQKAIENQTVKIDTVVTTDIHRLIRLADTLHGKTGLKKVIVPVSDIDSFDPLKSAVAFEGGSVKLLVSEAPEFRLGDVRYGPFKNQEAELPTAAALFLLCKGAAKLKETN